MIGFYDYTVVLTYISLASSVSGIFCAMTGHIRWAVFCLALSGLLDMFDGKVARTKKNRTGKEKSFGIQIDSLSDIVCFGVFPTVICYKLGMRHVFSVIILIFYALAGLIRLAYFNVLEGEKQMLGTQCETGEKFYHGLPITSMAVVLPILFVLSIWLPGYQWFLNLLHIVVAAVGILFVVDFKFRKPSNKELVVLVSIVAAAVLIILFCGRLGWGLCRLPFGRMR